MSDENKIQEKLVFKVHKRLPDKKWLIVGVVTMLFLACAVGGWLFVISQSKSDEPIVSTAQNIELAQDIKTEKVIKELDVIVAESGPESGQIFLDSKINNTNDPQEQAQLYSIKSTYSAFNVNEDNQSDALQSAYKADELYPDADTAYVIAYLEESVGNTAKAIEYYKIFIGRIPQPSEVYDNDFQYYSNYVKTLEAEIN